MATHDPEPKGTTPGYTGPALLPPDWNYWRHIEAPTLREFLLLLAGIEPRSDLAEEITNFLSRTTHYSPQYIFEPPIRPLIQKIRQWEKIAADNALAGTLCGIQYGSTGPNDDFLMRVLIRWATKRSFPIPQELSVIESDAIVPAAKETSGNTLQAASELKTRERETLLKLVIGMAIKGYRYDPKAARNNATSEIADDLEALGIGLDTDTIRKWLIQGTVLLDAKKSK